MSEYIVIFVEVYLINIIHNYMLYELKTYIKNFEINADSGKVTWKEISFEVFAGLATRLETVVTAYLYVILLVMSKL